MLRTVISLIVLAFSFVACTPEPFFYQGTVTYSPETISVSLSPEDQKELVEVGTITLNPTLFELAIEQSGFGRGITILTTDALTINLAKLTMEESVENFTYLDQLHLFAQVGTEVFDLGSLEMDDENRVFNSINLKLTEQDLEPLLAEIEPLSILIQPFFNQEFEEAKDFDLELSFDYDFTNASE